MGDIAFLAHRVPYPPDRGDKIRGYHIPEYLRQRKPVHLIAFADDPRDLGHDAELSARFASHRIVKRSKSNAVAGLQSLAQRRAASLAAFDHRDVHRAVADLIATHDIDTLYIFSSQMAQYAPAGFKGRVVMDFVDMDSAKFAAYADGARFPVSWVHAREARLLERHERAVAARADASLFVSEAEAALFRELTGAQRVHAVENGIDTDFYDPRADFTPVAEKGPLIVFTGQMDYRPNIDAAIWFARDVLPRIRAAQPDARFAIVGRRPAETVAALAELPGVIVTGEVADVRNWLGAANVAVAPLHLARGIQNKVLEAMAMALPVVATPAAAQGIDHDDTIRVADGAEAFGEVVAALIADPAASRALGDAARARMLERYGWAARLAPLDTLLGLAQGTDPSERAAA